VPDRVLCSPARRTRETLAALLPFLEGEGRVAIEPKLYDSTPGDYIAAIGRSGGEARTLMVIGHNPTIQATARWLAGDGEPGRLADLAAKYPTGALAVIDLGQTGWTHLQPGSGHLAAFIKPRDLDPGDAGDDGDD
jgi:phosphohistidine phosphatase